MELNKLVDFPTAKLLKEKGFNLMPFYIQSKTDYVLGYDYDIEDEEDNLKIREFQWEDHICSHLYLMPVYFDVVDWLLEKHGIWIRVDCNSKESWSPILVNIEDGGYKVHPYYVSQKFIEKNNRLFNSPKEAYLAAIEYTLKNLI